MHGIWKAIGSFVRRADMVLLSLCIALDWKFEDLFYF